MKKIIIAPDSFKGSISAADAACAISRGIASVYPEFIIKILPIADGGEGTLNAIVPAGDRFFTDVCSTYFAPMRAEIGVLGNTAVIESARAVGLGSTPPAHRRLLRSSSFGVGQMIVAALNREYRSIMLTIGGTGCNDGGAGMLEALGAAFYDKNGERICGIRAGDLLRIAKIDIGGIDRRLYQSEITIACDVKNPLLGKSGATYTYGSQKGGTANELLSLESGMQNFAATLTATTRKNMQATQGAGAGGGIPYPLITLLDARMTSGIDAVLDALSFDALSENAALIVTGEGQIDAQTGCGKAIVGITARAAAQGVPVLALAGRFIGNDADIRALGLEYLRTLEELTTDREYSMTHAAELLEQLAAMAASDIFAT